MPVAEFVTSLEAARAIVTPLIGGRTHVVTLVGIANTRAHAPVAELVPSLETARAIVTPLIGSRFAQGESITVQLVPVTAKLLSRGSDIGPLVPDPGDIVANLAALPRDRIGVAGALRGPEVAHVVFKRRAGSGQLLLLFADVLTVGANLGDVGADFLSQVALISALPLVNPHCIAPVSRPHIAVVLPEAVVIATPSVAPSVTVG